MSEQQQVATEPERQNSSNNKKPSLASYTLAEQIADEEIKDGKSQTLKQFYINLMDQLEIEGFPKEQISTVGKQIIIEKKFQKLKDVPKEEITIGSWWYDTARERGCIDLHYSHRTTEENEKPKTRYALENQELEEVVDDYIDFLRMYKSHIITNPLKSVVPSNLWNESILIMKQAVTHANERVNNKLKLSPSHYYILMRDSIFASGSKLSKMYFDHVRDKESFTPKQAGKVIRAILRDMPARYEPNTPDQAETCGFSGVPCPGCDSFRTEYVGSFEKIIYEDVKGNKYEHGIKSRKIKCYHENEKMYDAPIPSLPISEINNSEW